VERLTALVEAAGAPHEVVTGAEGLYHAFNRADLLVSDVSSVITDFLASGKPYVVTNSGTLDDDAFRDQFPSAQGAYILSGSGADVRGHVIDAIEHDSHAVARARTTDYLLGESPTDPVSRFIDAVETVLGEQRNLTAKTA
jgi:CDP-glycerol glycerophosphotransferase (TagB/SpsB family)